MSRAASAAHIQEVSWLFLGDGKSGNFLGADVVAQRIKPPLGMPASFVGVAGTQPSATAHPGDAR